MIWHILKYLSAFAFPVFYKRIGAKNIKNVRVKSPVIIAMNHPNAFTDPSIFTSIAYPARIWFLARGDAFKPGLISWLLEQIGIVPIFRIQDGGREGLKKNEDAYRRVNHILSRNKGMVVFAEGLCVQERRLRPLKKGVARMVFGAYEFLNNEELVVVPVGVNYSQPDKFRSTLFYNVGEPIPVKDFISEYKLNAAKGNKLFLQTLEPKMKELITHINNKEYDAVVLQMEELCKKELLIEQGLNYKNLEHDYLITKQITEKVNVAEINNKEILEEFKIKSETYFKEVRANSLRDWLIDPNQNKKVNGINLVVRYLLITLGFPLHVLGLIGNYLPYKTTEKLTKKILKGNKEFYSSITIGLGIILFLINYLVWFFISYAFSPAIVYPILISVLFSLAGWFSINYYYFMLKTFGMAKALKNKKLTSSLLEKRKELVSLINKF